MQISAAIRSLKSRHEGHGAQQSSSLIIRGHECERTTGQALRREGSDSTEVRFSFFDDLFSLCLDLALAGSAQWPAMQLTLGLAYNKTAQHEHALPESGMFALIVRFQELPLFVSGPQPVAGYFGQIQGGPFFSP